MNVKRLAPWNWFQHEEKEGERSVPVNSELARSVPAYPVSQLHREIDRLFDEAFRGFPSVFRTRWEWPEETPVVLSPSIDIKESEKDYVVTVEVPGVAKEDVDIQIEGNRLTIHGEKKQEKKEEKENYHCVERHYGSFERTLALPQDANAEDVSANFKDGVLTIDIKRKAKSAPKETRKIEVKAA
jgi:HSP20 family protein